MNRNDGIIRAKRSLFHGREGHRTGVAFELTVEGRGTAERNGSVGTGGSGLRFVDAARADTGLATNVRLLGNIWSAVTDLGRRTASGRDCCLWSLAGDSQTTVAAKWIKWTDTRVASTRATEAGQGHVVVWGQCTQPSLNHANRLPPLIVHIRQTRQQRASRTIRVCRTQHTNSGSDMVKVFFLTSQASLRPQ